VRLLPLSALLPTGRPADFRVAECSGESLVFADLRDDVAANAARLSARPIHRGMLVAEDSYWFLVGLLALFQAGAEIVLPPNAQPGTLETLRDTADLVVSDRALDGFGRGFVLAPAGAPGGIALRALDPEACRLILFTSGSTGERKRVAKTLAQLEREVVVLESLWGGLLGDSRVLAMIGHQHIFGMTFRLLWPVMAGRPFAAESHIAWEPLLAQLGSRAALIVSPAHLSRLGGLAPLPRVRRPSAVITAGAPLSREAAREAEALFGTLPLEVFGSTETGAFAWRQQHEAGVPWQALPGIEFQTSLDGTLALRSPFLPTNEIYRSADSVELVDGGFNFRGRIDRIVKIEGKRVSLVEVERNLKRLPWVVDAALVPLGGERPVLAAAVTLSTEGRRELATLGKFRFERLLRRALGETQESAALPRRWRFVDRLPIDAMGKRQAVAIERLLGERPGPMR
jgi:acyl-coenzyme A synthetase/AMP-(fatty) acid ligase